MNNVCQIRDVFKKHAEEKPSSHTMFFKTGPGEYAEHDRFMGVSVPTVRKVAKQFSCISLEEIQQLLESPYNEERLLGLFILVSHYQKADANEKNKLYHFYIKNITYVNNWNLVDSSAHYILGAHVWNGDKDILVRYAQSNDLWQKRVAIISTLYFIRQSDLEWTFSIAQQLLQDKHDLIHKAVGWMLREVGKKDKEALCSFLDEHAPTMPRTMLRYAIEKFSQDERLEYLKRR